MEVNIVNYIKVRSLDTRKIGTLEGCEQELSKEELVVVEDKDRGEDVVEVIGATKEAPKNGLRFSFVRKLTPRDKRVLERNESESSRAFSTCKEKIKEYSLDMHLLKAYIPLSSTKVFFYYTADKRVDFRQLVRDLAKVLKKRIEMRQVGVRDAVQMMGWMGLCGEVPCCVRFLESFDSISLKDIE
jgi:cell fate regulator YaaT (PSP1 superfamily)